MKNKNIKNKTESPAKTNSTPGSTPGAQQLATGPAPKVASDWQAPQPLELVAQPGSLPDALDPNETQELENCETIIGRGWDTFLEVGTALTIIRDKRLYRDRYAAFDDYCRERWGFTKTHANRFIRAANVATLLAPIGANPESESQLRPLFAMAAKAPEKVPVVWQKAQELAGDRRLTATLVKRAALELEPAAKTASKTIPKKSQSVGQIALDRAFDLIGQAEKAATKNDIPAVLKLLGEIRDHLRPPQKADPEVSKGAKPTE